ncbi:hypothetical protein Sjap_008116 [Stephania japonica]|uniref:pyruvate kinase n=1 Tax=Stephania japonica TaxID=461633 RepID=A0AAP0JR88_9MAGN
MASQALHFLIPTYSAPNRSLSRVSSPSKPLLFAQSPRRVRPISAISSDIESSPSSPSVLISGNGKGGIFGGDGAAAVADASGIEVDAVTEAEMKENGFRSTRRTKLVCTIGPATCGFEQLEALAVGGMNVARINMCHGTRDWHRRVIEQVRRLNEEKGYAVAIMMDTEGSEIHMGDVGGAASAARAEDGEIWTFSVRAFDSPLPERTINVNYEGFAEDVKVGDDLLVDGGMVRFEVIEKIGPDVKCRCTDPGLLLPRANLTFWRDGSLVRERNAMLPTISSKSVDATDPSAGDNYPPDLVVPQKWRSGGDPYPLDPTVREEWRSNGESDPAHLQPMAVHPQFIIKWNCGLKVKSMPMAFVVIIGHSIGILKAAAESVLPHLTNVTLHHPLPIDWLDIDFGISEGVDFIAISFVKSAEVITHLKSYIAARSRDSDIAVIAKIESVDSLKNLEEIIRASDGAMVARGDLGAQIPLEQVPSAQQKIVQLCRQLDRPVIVASQLLESMIEYPTPTRAEVADVSEAVRQRADALMLSGESAMGQYPEKALTVLRSVSLRIEKWWREEKRQEAMVLPEISSSFADSISEEICNSAAKMADNLEVDAIFVYTKAGQMASLLSRCRPDCPIFAFTTTTSVRRRLNLQWGLIPFRLNFSDDMESNLNRTFSLLKARGMIQSGDLVIAVSDMLQSIQVMNVP